MAESVDIIENKLPNVIAIDFNLGCPQECAEKGMYGAFLMEEFDITSKCVKSLSITSKVPIFCKIRIAKTLHDTIGYAKMLQDSG